jgi:hypothetical protein
VRFVKRLLIAIEDEIPHLPALENYEAKKTCRCAVGRVLQGDICMLSATVYQREEQPHMKAFAALAAYVFKNCAPGSPFLDINYLSDICGVKIEILKNARTDFGVSMPTILIQCGVLLTSSSRGLLRNI